MFWSKNYFGQETFWVKKTFLVTHFLSQKNFGQKILGQKNFWVKKILGSKRFGSDFFVKKKQVGLTQGEGYMTPPSKKIVGLKLCCVDVSFVR